MAKAATPSFYDAIVAEVGTGDPPKKCRHQRYLWCEECRTESWSLGSVIGRQEGLNTAAHELRLAVGKLFADGKDGEAAMLRTYMRKIEDLAKETGEHADEIREQQGPKTRR